MTTTGRRGRRVGEAVKLHLAQTLQRRLGDPRLDGLVVTDVSVTDDLSIARVAVRLMGPDDERLRAEALKALGRASGLLRRDLAPKLRLKRVPELRFSYDTGPDAVARVEELLEEIAAEPRGDE